MSKLRLIIRKTRQDLLREKRSKVIILIISLFAMLSIWVGFSRYDESNARVEEYRSETREHWENKPDKHPHRMAHYGYMVFREAHPLQVFDGGLDDFLGNVIFLEAHKQNTANLSEASASGTLVRFGTFNCAFILQVLVPLILIFVGFSLIAKEREDATLKLLNVQGLSSRDIIWGKMLGLWEFSNIFLVPIFLFAFLATLFLGTVSLFDIFLRMLLLVPGYMVFYFFVCMLTVLVSSRTKTSAPALVTLIGCWLFLVVFLPKGVQFLAQNIYKTPSRIAFETRVEEQALKVGDSHNPDDPHFKHLKDSLLMHYHVKTTEQLPVNYSGIVMKEGEKITSGIYNANLALLQQKYDSQQNLNALAGFINPLMALKNFSMTVSGTDYFSYTEFQKSAEEYRYKLAQHMNDLQIEQIGNIKDGKSATISKSNWKQFPQFEYQLVSLQDGIGHQWIAPLALIFWLLGSIFLVEWSAQKLKFL